MKEKISVLIVDNDNKELKMISDFLDGQEDHPCEIIPAANYTEAMNKACQNTFNLALIDLQLDGDIRLDLVKALKDHDPQLEIIIYSGHSSTETVINALNLGVFAYLSKPVDLSELKTCQIKALKKQNTEKALKDKLFDLENLHREAVNREIDMLKLEKELEELNKQNGR